MALQEEDNNVQFCNSALIVVFTFVEYLTFPVSPGFVVNAWAYTQPSISPGTLKVQVEEEQEEKTVIMTYLRSRD